jgi:hypothetical protein
MLAVNIKAKRFRQILWLLMTVSLAVWAYLRLHLGLPAPVDVLVLVALLAEAALILGHRPVR